MASKTAILAVRIVSDADARGFKKAAREVSNFSKKAAAAGVKATAITGAVAALGGVVGNLAIGVAAAGAVALPALAALAIGFDGIKKAAEEAAPAAGALKEAVSGAFAESMADGFKAAGTILESITPTMANTAAQVGGMFTGLMDHIATTGTEGINALVRASGEMIAAMGPGITQMIDGFLAIGPAVEPVASQLGAAFGDLIGSIGRGFSELASSGTLTSLVESFSAAISSMGGLIEVLIVALGRMGEAIGPHLAPIFDALTVAITAATGPLSEMAAIVGEAVAVAFTTLAPAIGPILEAMSGILAAVLPLIAPLAEIAAVVGQALAEAVIAVSPLLAEIAAVIGQALSAALDAVAPIFPVIVDAIMQLVQALLPAIPPLSEIAMALFPALGQIIQAVAPLFSQLVGIVVQMLNAVMPLLPPIAQLAQSLFPVLADVISIVAQVLTPIIGVIGDLAAKITGWLVPALETGINFFNGIVGAIGTVIDWIASLLEWIGAIRWPTPPAWVSELFSDPAMVTFGPATNGLVTAAVSPGPSALRIASSSRGASPTVINIRVDGALDPMAVADQIAGLLHRRGLRT